MVVPSQGVAQLCWGRGRQHLKHSHVRLRRDEPAGDTVTMVSAGPRSEPGEWITSETRTNLVRINWCVGSLVLGLELNQEVRLFQWVPAHSKRDEYSYTFWPLFYDFFQKDSVKLSLSTLVHAETYLKKKKGS